MNRLGYPYDIPFARLKDLMSPEQAEAIARSIKTWYGVSDVIEGSILALRNTGLTGNCAVRFAIAAGIQFSNRRESAPGVITAYNEAAQMREREWSRVEMLCALTKLLDDPMFATEAREAA